MTWKRDVQKLCETMVKPVTLNTPAVIHGVKHEVDGRKAFEDITGLTVKSSGLQICPTHPFIAASPDGLVGNNCVLEIKCPYTGRESKIKPGPMFPFLAFSGQNIILKKNSKYYDQIQGQMGVTGRNRAYFVVYTFVDVCIINVDFDEEFWLYSMLPKLELFYHKYFKTFVSSLL